MALAELLELLGGYGVLLRQMLECQEQGHDQGQECRQWRNEGRAAIASLVASIATVGGEA